MLSDSAWVAAGNGRGHADEIDADADVAGPSSAPTAAVSHVREPSLAVLTVILLLSLWLASGSLVLGVTDGGEHPVRRLLIGALLAAAGAMALWQRRVVWAWLCARPWLVVPVAAVQLAAATLDGLLPSGPYVVFSVTSVVLALVVARPRIVWLTVALLDCGYAVGILLDRSPTQLVHEGDLSVVVGSLLGYPFAALLGLGVARLFTTYLANAGLTIEELRHGAPALTPALAAAIQRGPAPRALLRAPSPYTTLTPTERRVVEGLAAGSTPKQLAHARGISLTTVRTHIRHAKRKTGARTLPELSAMAARADWREPDGHGL